MPNKMHPANIICRLFLYSKLYKICILYNYIGFEMLHLLELQSLKITKFPIFQELTMISTLGFDSIAIHINRFSSDIPQALEYFYSLGIKNFLFIFDYDPLIDSIAITKNRMQKFKHTQKLSILRMNIKCAFNLCITQGAGFNESIQQIYCNKKSKSLLVSLPLFTDKNYDPIALDINHLLYKKSTFLTFTHFEEIVESSSIDFCLKFINNPRIGLSIDLNYLLDPQKEIFVRKILDNNNLTLPSISRDISNYAGTLASANFIIDKYGKKSYYKLCSQINKASNKLF